MLIKSNDIFFIDKTIVLLYYFIEQAIAYYNFILFYLRETLRKGELL